MSNNSELECVRGSRLEMQHYRQYLDKKGKCEYHKSPQSLSLKKMTGESPPMQNKTRSSLKMEMLQKKSSKLSFSRKQSQKRFKNTDLIEEANLEL